jgi:hypothetical protein
MDILHLEHPLALAFGQELVQPNQYHNTQQAPKEKLVKKN